MEQLKQGLPPAFVASWECLAGEGLDEVVRFLQENEIAIEQAYAAAHARAAAERHAWEEKNREVLARDLNQLPPPPDADGHWLALREKLIAARKTLSESSHSTDAD